MTRGLRREVFMHICHELGYDPDKVMSVRINQDNVRVAHEKGPGLDITVHPLDEPEEA